MELNGIEWEELVDGSVAHLLEFKGYLIGVVDYQLRYSGNNGSIWYDATMDNYDIEVTYKSTNSNICRYNDMLLGLFTTDAESEPRIYYTTTGTTCNSLSNGGNVGYGHPTGIYYSESFIPNN